MAFGIIVKAKYHVLGIRFSSNTHQDVYQKSDQIMARGYVGCFEEYCEEELRP